jgi:hypothetical protein
MNETPRRRITVTSSFNGLYTKQLGNSVGWRRGREVLLRPPHRKKKLSIFPSPAGMSLTKLSEIIYT